MLGGKLLGIAVLVVFLVNVFGLDIVDDLDFQIADLFQPGVNGVDLSEQFVISPGLF